MDALPYTSTESYVERHHRLSEQLRAGLIADPERGLFVKLLDDPPDSLGGTPFLHDVSWRNGRFDLLFTDGRGTWCAVEVKDAPMICRSGRQRKNRKTTWKRRYAKLVAQAELALIMCQELVVGTVRVRALGLWHEDGEWVVAAQLSGARAVQLALATPPRGSWDTP